MSLSDELAYMNAAEMARRVRARDLSPVEIVDAFLERIEARNPGITAFVHVAAEDARKEAKRAEREVMSGAALGPLHGIPTASAPTARRPAPPPGNGRGRSRTNVICRAITHFPAAGNRRPGLRRVPVPDAMASMQRNEPPAPVSLAHV